jgi:hypothetical protein
MHDSQVTTVPWQQQASPVGSWERKLEDGGKWIWLIKDDGSFSVSSNGKEFVNGHYRIDQGIYDVNDPNCNDAYHGRYRFTIHQDSIRFQAIADTCLSRRGGMHNTGWKRTTDSK